MKRLLYLLLFCISLTQSFTTHADQVIYQPGPIPGTDVWITNYYSYGSDYGVDDANLRAGGWGDWYHFLIKFDLTDLPANATQVRLLMYPFSSGGTPVSMPYDRMLTDWNENLGWYNTYISGTQVGTFPAPMIGIWSSFTLTNIYNGWKSGLYPNYGLRFRPSGNNNQFSEFRSSDYPTHWQRPKLVVDYNGANFGFPLPGSPYTAPISAVFDHHVDTGFNCHDGVVVAYTGEVGTERVAPSENSNWSTANQSESCPTDILRGYKNSDGTTFIINWQYVSPDANGNNLFLFYDGHTGYDYPVDYGTDVYAAADGVAHFEGNANDIKVVHASSGYDTYYLHLSSRVIAHQQVVSKGDLIGKTGGDHLHFTVKKGTQRVDPYGWKGEWNTDPQRVGGKDNVCLWEMCQ